MNKFLSFLPWVLLLIVCGFYWYETHKIPETLPAAKLAPPKVNVPIEKRYTDAEGNQHVLLQDGKNVISKAEIKNPERPTNIIDSSAMLLKIAAEKIQQVTQINSLTRDSLLKARKEINSLSRRLSYFYSDAFVKLRFTPPLDTSDINDNGTFDFAYNANLIITQYQKRNWFLGAKKSYIDISSKDPRTTIMGVKQLTVQQQTPQFGLRIQGSANYNVSTGNGGFGPAVRVDLGRFSLQGNYMRYPMLGKWYTAITGNYDIIRF